MSGTGRGYCTTDPNTETVPPAPLVIGCLQVEGAHVTMCIPAYSVTV